VENAHPARLLLSQRVFAAALPAIRFVLFTKRVEGVFCEVRQDELEGMKHKKRTGVLVPALLVAFSKALALGVVGPYLAVDLLD
jgi:hypothetical protein